MSLYLTCKITIGAYLFDMVNDVSITKSRKQLTNTAVIKMPNKFSSEYLCNHINSGDEVTISLGYNDELREEFRGYVADIGVNSPVEIYCEDEMYQLKRVKPTTKTFESTTLKGLLQYLVPSVTLSNIPDITLSPFYVYGDKSVAHALQELRDNFGLEVSFNGNKLFVGVPLTEADAANSEVVNYDLERNVIDPRLNFRRSTDTRIKVIAKSITPDNKVITAEVGDDDAATTTTLHFYNITVKAELQRQAEEKLKVMKYDGFSGEITTFGLPVAEPGQIASIIDKRFNGSRSGKYFIDAVTTTFGLNGFRRVVKIGRKAG